jgi:beta-phosphoglucomutase-like phosphatase (HAD superfamily)
MDAVIFDCDGVLIDSETIAHEVELDAFQRIGLFLTAVNTGPDFRG